MIKLNANLTPEQYEMILSSLNVSIDMLKKKDLNKLAEEYEKLRDEIDIFKEVEIKEKVSNNK